MHIQENCRKGGYGPISVGHDVWIANGCKIYKNVSIPRSVWWEPTQSCTSPWNAKPTL